MADGGRGTVAFHGFAPHEMWAIDAAMLATNHQEAPALRNVVDERKAEA